MRKLGLDTEADWINGKYVPFVMTTYDLKTLKSKYFDLTDKRQFKKAKKIAESNIRKVFHNAAFDITALLNIGIEIDSSRIDDTMVQANIVNENFETKALKKLAGRYLDESCLEEKELKKAIKETKKELTWPGKWPKGEDLPYSMIPRSKLKAYACKDPYYTVKLDKLFSRDIRRYSDVYQLELDIIPVIVDMQRNGMRIDRGFVKRMFDSYTEEMHACENGMRRYLANHDIIFNKTQVYKRYPKQCEKWDEITERKDGAFFAEKVIDFNPGSKKHVEYVLRELDIDTGKVTSEKTRQMAVDKDSLKPFAEHKFVKIYLRWMFLSKQVGTYYGPLYYWYTSDTNERAHFGLYQSGAKSGRFSAELIQTIPRKDEDKEEKDIRVIRNAFIPEDGYYFAAVDYDQIEMRLFAHFSNCKILIRDLIAGMDPHDSTTLALFPEARPVYEKIQKLKKSGRKPKLLAKLKIKFKGFRRKAKNLQFGIIYGMGQDKLARSLEVSTMESADILRVYYRKYPVKEYIKSTIGELYRTGSVKVTINRPLLKLYREYRVPHELAYKAVNIIIQGTAAYAMKAGMLRAWKWTKENKKYPGIRLLMTIHDELIFEIPDKYRKEEVVPKLTELMSDRTSFKVPIIASPKVSDKSWGDAKEWRLAA